MLQAIHRFCLTLHFSKAGTNNHITKLIMGYYEISSSCFTTIYPCIEHLNMYKALLDMKNTSYDHTNKLGYASWVWKNIWLNVDYITNIYIYIHIYIYTSHVCAVETWIVSLPCAIDHCTFRFVWEIFGLIHGRKSGDIQWWYIQYISLWIPSGKHTKRAIENGHRNSGFTH